MEAFQAGVECARETPSGGNFGIQALADHLHAYKYNKLQERENPQTLYGAPLNK